MSWCELNGVLRDPCVFHRFTTVGMFWLYDRNIVNLNKSDHTISTTIVYTPIPKPNTRNLRDPSKTFWTNHDHGRPAPTHVAPQKERVAQIAWHRAADAGAVDHTIGFQGLLLRFIRCRFVGFNPLLALRSLEIPFLNPRSGGSTRHPHHKRA